MYVRLPGFPVQPSLPNMLQLIGTPICVQNQMTLF